MKVCGIESKARPAAFTDAPDDSPFAASFHQDRGIGQGDTPSGIFWVVLYDVLLCMLDVPTATNSGHFLARGPAGTLYAAGNIFYADNLCTPAGTLELSQHHADIVSTFCAATTLTIAANKVLAFALHSSQPQNLILHDWTWTEHEVPFSDTGVAMTYLGLDSAHHQGDAAAHTSTTTVIRAGSTALQHRIASSACKLDVALMQLFPKVLYPAANTCWSLNDYHQLDRVLAPLLKHTSRYMHFFPSSHGGTGHHKLSDLAQTRKWSELRRALDTPGEAALAAHGLLERGLRQVEYISLPAITRQFPPTNIQYLRSHVGSRIEWGTATHCTLAVAPATALLPADSPITAFPSP